MADAVPAMHPIQHLGKSGRRQSRALCHSPIEPTQKSVPVVRIVLPCILPVQYHRHDPCAMNAVADVLQPVNKIGNGPLRAPL